MAFYILFGLIPLAEIVVFYMLGNTIGLVSTLLLCLLTAGGGGYIVKQQGIHALWKFKDALEKGLIPVDEILEGFFIVLAGAALITPGLLTDVFGGALLVPRARTVIIDFVKTHMAIHLEEKKSSVASNSNVIDGEYEIQDNEK